SPSVRMTKKSPPTTEVSDKKPKQGGLLYSDSPNMDAPHVRPPVQYRQDGDDDFDDDDEYDNDGNVDFGDNSTVSTPSWV
ncbi:Hypothetical predicted protein, partial [Paramuricea clavata]